MKRQKYIITTTRLDSQGYRMTKSALEKALQSINGPRKMRLGLEHIRTFPPFGVVMNGEMYQGEDKEYYLCADNVFFDKRDFFILEDETQLVKEYFSEGNFPFIECEGGEIDKLNIATDPANYESHKEIFELNKIVSEYSGLEFTESGIGRKSQLPDPETIITITKTIAISLGIIKTKIPEKIGEAIAEDLVKFYKLISRLAIETIKKVKPSNRPTTFVIVYPNDECNIELVITTNKPDKVLASIGKEKLNSIENKIQQLQNLHPEKIQFIYNEREQWEFNYLLSNDGSTVGTIKSFNKRNQLYNEILKKQDESEKGNSQR
jgi:hypothetical protein